MALDPRFEVLFDDAGPPTVPHLNSAAGSWQYFPPRGPRSLALCRLCALAATCQAHHTGGRHLRLNLDLATAHSASAFLRSWELRAATEAR